MSEFQTLLSTGNPADHEKIGKYVGLFPLDHPLRQQVSEYPAIVERMAKVKPCATAREAMRTMGAQSVDVDALTLRVVDAIRDAADPRRSDARHGRITPVMQRHMGRAQAAAEARNVRAGRSRSPGSY